MGAASRGGTPFRASVDAQHNTASRANRSGLQICDELSRFNAHCVRAPSAPRESGTSPATTLLGNLTARQRSCGSYCFPHRGVCDVFPPQGIDVRRQDPRCRSALWRDAVGAVRRRHRRTQRRAHLLDAILPCRGPGNPRHAARHRSRRVQPSRDGRADDRAAYREERRSGCRLQEEALRGARRRAAPGRQQGTGLDCGLCDRPSSAS